jgi:hypothetical protein
MRSLRIQLLWTRILAFGQGEERLTKRTLEDATRISPLKNAFELLDRFPCVFCRMGLDCIAGVAESRRGGYGQC